FMVEGKVQSSGQLPRGDLAVGQPFGIPVGGRARLEVEFTLGAHSISRYQLTPTAASAPRGISFYWEFFSRRERENAKRGTNAMAFSLRSLRSMRPPPLF